MSGDANLQISTATERDAGEILVLQRCCWVTEAQIANDLYLAPLTESVDDISGWISSHTALCLRDNGRLVGSVRGEVDGSKFLIGRLMVAPDQQSKGFGRLLLQNIEAAAPSTVTTYELFVLAQNTRNVGMYEKSGYHESSRGLYKDSPRVPIVYMQKHKEP